MSTPRGQSPIARAGATVSLSEELDALANRVNLNSFSRVDPEGFQAEKSDIAVTLRRLAKRVRGSSGEAREPTTVWRAPNGR